MRTTVRATAVTVRATARARVRPCAPACIHACLREWGRARGQVLMRTCVRVCGLRHRPKIPCTWLRRCMATSADVHFDSAYLLLPREFGIFFEKAADWRPFHPKNRNLAGGFGNLPEPALQAAPGATRQSMRRCCFALCCLVHCSCALSKCPCSLTVRVTAGSDPKKKKSPAVSFSDPGPLLTPKNESCSA